jgi:hypothetical protein
MIHTAIKSRNPNRRFSKLVRNSESRIKEFAERHKLPIVEIDGLVRPVLGSGLWNPIFHLIGVDESDADELELDTSCGRGHLVGPFKKPTSEASEWLNSLAWNDESNREWMNSPDIINSLPFRAGALILAAAQLGIPIRHADCRMVDVELCLPSTKPIRPKRKRNRKPWELV